MQAFSSLHMAEFGFEEHEHNDRLCDVYLHHENVKYSDGDEAPTVEHPEHYAFKAVLPALTLIVSEHYRVSAPRAPPIFS